MRDLHQLRPATGLDRREVKHHFCSPVPSVDEIEVVIEHAGRVGARHVVVRDELDVDGADLTGQFDGADDLLVLKIPYSDAAAEVNISVHRVQRGGRTYVIASDHEIEFWPDGNAVRIKAVLWRIGRVFADEVKLTVKLRHAAGGMTLRSTHHGDQEAAFGQGMEFIADRGEWRVSSHDELGSSRVRDIPEENLFLPF